VWNSSRYPPSMFILSDCVILNSCAMTAIRRIALLCWESRLLRIPRGHLPSNCKSPNGLAGDEERIMNSPYGLPCVECRNCHLRPKNFFCALSKESLKVLDHIKHPAVYPEHAVIFVEGQPPRGIFMLCQGQAKLSANSQDGKTLILRVAKAGEVLGLQATITGRPYDVTVETMQPCQLNFVSREDFFRSSNSTVMPVYKLHSMSAVIITTHAMSPALSDCRTPFRRGSPSSCCNRQPREKSLTE